MDTTLTYKRFEKNKFSIYELNLIVIFTGYPLISFLPDLLSLDAKLVTIPFRIVTLIINLCAFFFAINNERSAKKSFLTWFPIVFYLLYILRILSNLAFGPDVDYRLSAGEYIFWSVGVCFIPMLSVRYVQKINFIRVAKLSIYILTAVLIMSIFNNKEILGNSLDSRVNANSALNTITYGHLGVTLSLLSLTFIEFKIKKIFYIITFVLGIYIILIAGSRSPIIAFVICLIYLAITRRGRWIVGTLVGGIAMTIVGFTVFLGFIERVNPLIVDRLTASVIYRDKSEERTALYKDAIDDFLKNPITGRHFLLTHGIGEGFYPHNLVLESFMALGFFGGCLFIYLVIKALVICFKTSKKDIPYSWIGVLFIQFLILGLASGSLWGSQTFWVMMVMLFSIYDTKGLHNKYRKSVINR